jgi:hypothetical protein
MSNFEEKEYTVFDLFQKQWALVSAGNMEEARAGRSSPYTSIQRAIHVIF